VDIALAAVTILTGAGTAVVLALRWWTWQPLMKRRIVVQLVDGTTAAGICMSRRGPLMVLADVTLHAGGSAREIDGEIVVDRDRVLWAQVIS
jgi:hypothetical protein